MSMIKRPTQAKVGEHFAVADFGNIPGLLTVQDLFRFPYAVVVIEHSPPDGLRYEVRYRGLGDEWTVVGQIADEAAARGRLQHAVSDPEWRLLDNNCEHVTWLVATGQKKSLQVEGAAVVVGIVALLLLFGGDDSEKREAV